MASLESFLSSEFDSNLLPALCEFVKIPNLSPGFDPAWETNGHAQHACDHIVTWIRSQKLSGCTVDVIKEKGFTHLILVDVAATVPNPKTVVVYGHWDKQPPLEGKWKPGLDPRNPVIKDGLLYGRGCADDGYASFAAVLAVKACQKFGMKLPHIVMLFESCEESGKGDLEHYLLGPALASLKTVDLVLCLDCGDVEAEHLWVTSSLKGLVNVDLRVRILKESVHSGDAGGIVPETFSICRTLLSRIEDAGTGKIAGELHVPILPAYRASAEQFASVMGSHAIEMLPWLPECVPKNVDVAERALEIAWRPTLTITGAEGLPLLNDAGNVLRSSTGLRLSVRLPPTLNAVKAKDFLIKTLTTDPPYGAQVTVEVAGMASGWAALEYPEELKNALNRAAHKAFGKDYLRVGGGGSIPFMPCLNKRFPKAFFILTGAATMTCCAHAPNENLDLGYTKKFLVALTELINEIAMLK